MQIKAEEEFHSEELADGDQKLSVLTIEFSDITEANARLEDECEELKAKLEHLEKQVIMGSHIYVYYTFLNFVFQ